MNIADVGTPALVTNDLSGLFQPNGICPKAREVPFIILQVGHPSSQLARADIPVVVDDTECFTSGAGHGPAC